MRFDVIPFRMVSVNRYAKKAVDDPDHPCSNEPLSPVPEPPEWSRRSKSSRCPTSRKDVPDVIPDDVGIVDVRPNVMPRNKLLKTTRDDGCRAIFLSWSVYSHVDRCVVANVQDIWLLGARLHIDEKEANRSRVGGINKESGKRERHKNVNSWFYGFYAPPGSIDPDPSSAMDIRYDPWTVVHPGFYETDESDRGNSRLGRSVRDDRFADGLQLAAVHIWIDPVTRSPRTVSYRALRRVDLRTMSSGGLLARSSSLSIAALAGAVAGAAAMHLSKRA